MNAGGAPPARTDPLPLPASLSSLVPFLAELRDAIVAFGPTGRWLYGNPSFNGLVGPVVPDGREASDASDGSAPSWVSPESAERWRFFFEMHRTGRAVELGLGPVDIDIVTPSKSRRPATVLWDRVVSPDGDILTMLGLIRPRPEHDAPEVPDLTSIFQDLAATLDRLSQASSLTRGDNHRSGPNDPLNGHPIDGSAPTPHLAELSPREAEILSHMLAGQRVSTTARELYLSEHTVRNHLKRIYRKLGVHSLGELRERHTTAVP